MKKSNWIIITVLVIASIIFLILWFALGFNLEHDLDLILTIIWWILVVVICVTIHLVEKRRQVALRKSFLAQGFIFNPEAGMVRLNAGENEVDALEKVLDSLDYDVEKPRTPRDSNIKFDYVVSSNKFSEKNNVWEGEVVDVATNNTARFQNKMELKRLLGVA